MLLSDLQRVRSAPSSGIAPQKRTLPMQYRETWDLTSIPDDLLLSEYKRRQSLRRRVFAGGRPKVIRSCTKCGAELSARELRTHKCTASAVKSKN
jgi:hypothetical protein